MSWQLTSSLNGAIATVCASVPRLQLSGSPELPRLTWVNGRSQPVELSRWSVTLVATKAAWCGTLLVTYKFWVR